MRRLVAVLMLAAAPALADSALIVWPPTSVGQEQEQDQIMVSMVRKYGGLMDVIPATAITAAELKAGTYSALGGKHYDAQVLMGVVFGQAQAPVSPAALLLASGWPAIPTLFVMSPNHFAAEWGSAVLDSNSVTGGTGPTLPGGSYQNYKVSSYFAVGYPEVFRNLWQSPFGAATRSPRISTTVGGIWRPIVGLTTNSIGIRDGGLRNFIDADSLATPAARRSDPDTFALAARYRSSKEPAPLFFLHGAGASGQIHPGLAMMGLAALDSAAKRLVFGTAAQAKTISLLIRGGFSRGHYNRLSLIESGGLFCYADSCDSNTVKATIDSLVTLGARGARFTVTFDPDSVFFYPYEKAWWKKLDPYVSYTPMSAAGVIAGNAATQAQKYRLNDVFGRLRARTMVDPGKTVPYPCAQFDTSCGCGVKNGFARSDSIFGKSKTDHAIVPAWADYLPTSFNRAAANNLSVAGAAGSATGQDSVFWTYYVQGGARAIVIDPDFNFSKPGNSWDQVSGMTSTPGTNPGDFSPVQERVPIYASPGPVGGTGGIIGYMSILGSRGWPADVGAPFDVSHDFHMELLWGRLCGQWYVDHGLVGYNTYSHYFDTDLAVAQVTVSNLGGSGTSWTGRAGWYEFKWLVNEVSVINRLAGRPLVTFTKLEDNIP